MAEVLYKADDYNYIVIDGFKVKDIAVGSGYAGCRCRTSDRNRYDKESQTIICDNYNKCIGSVLRKLSEDTKEDIKEEIATHMLYV